MWRRICRNKNSDSGKWKLFVCKCGEVIYRNPADLSPLPENPRTITKAQLQKLVDSIKVNGFYKHRPLAIEDRDGKLVVLDGNQRLKAANKLKLEKVPTVLYSELDDDERAEIILRGNINNGEWDFNALKVDDIWQDVNFDFRGLEMPKEKEKKSKKELIMRRRMWI